VPISTPAPADAGATLSVLDREDSSATEQLKQELIAAFKAEIQTAKADILAEVRHLVTNQASGT